MRTLPEEIDELISRAKYIEEKHPGTAITPSMRRPVSVKLFFLFSFFFFVSLFLQIDSH